VPTHRYLKHVTDQHAEDVDVFLIRMTCADFPDWSDLTAEDFEDFPLDWDANTMYFVNNPEAITSRGHTYIPWMFELTLPAQGTDVSGSNLRFENLDRRIGDAIKLLPGDAQITVAAEIVLADTPDIVEESFADFTLNTIRLQNVAIEAQLAPPNDAAEPFCSFKFSPSLTPGVFPQ